MKVVRRSSRGFRLHHAPSGRFVMTNYDVAVMAPDDFARREDKWEIAQARTLYRTERLDPHTLQAVQAAAKLITKVLVRELKRLGAKEIEIKEVKRLYNSPPKIDWSGRKKLANEYRRRGISY